jgi:hypothetical protein
VVVNERRNIMRSFEIARRRTLVSVSDSAESIVRLAQQYNDEARRNNWSAPVLDAIWERICVQQNMISEDLYAQNKAEKSHG